MYCKICHKDFTPSDIFIRVNEFPICASCASSHYVSDLVTLKIATTESETPDDAIVVDAVAVSD